MLVSYDFIVCFINLCSSRKKKIRAKYLTHSNPANCWKYLANFRCLSILSDADFKKYASEHIVINWKELEQNQTTPPLHK